MATSYTRNLHEHTLDGCSSERTTGSDEASKRSEAGVGDVGQARLGELADLGDSTSDTVVNGGLGGSD
jgi:hypothetical protein